MIASGPITQQRSTEDSPPVANHLRGLAKASHPLEDKLHGKLNLPRRGSGKNLHECGTVHVALYRTSDLGGGARGRASGRGEVRAIEGVVAFSSELEEFRLGDIEILEYRNVAVDIVRPAIPVAFGVAECVFRRNHEAGRVVPFLHCLVETRRFKLTAWHVVGPLCCPRVGVIGRDPGTKIDPIMDLGDIADIPPADE